jgi:outer membrane protein
MKSLVALITLVFSLNSFSMIIGKVDIQRVLLSVSQGKKVRDQLKAEFEKKKKILDKEQQKIKKMQEDFQKQSLVMSDSAKVEKEKQLQEAVMKLQQKSLGFQKEIQEMENKMKGPIIDRVREVVTTISKKSKVDVTFEASTAPVVYAKNEKDLTEDVIKAYDKKFPN